MDGGWGGEVNLIVNRLNLLQGHIRGKVVNALKIMVQVQVGGLNPSSRFGTCWYIRGS